MLLLDEGVGRDAKAGDGGAVFGAGTTKAAPAAQAPRAQPAAAAAAPAGVAPKKKKKGGCMIL